MCEVWKPKTKTIAEKLTIKETENPSVSLSCSESELTGPNSENTVDSVESQSVVDSTTHSNLHKKPDLGDRYKVLEFLGAGGMGSVWKVFDKELKEHFAVKVLLPALVADDASLKRFQKEAELASELNHPNIVAIYGAGSDVDGNPTIIMRLVQGESLEDVLKREGKLSEERAIDIAQQICEALVYSHSKGIVHRDVKPSNIIISKTESGADLVQLVDFGIARCVYEQQTATMAITKAVDMLGSPLYMSPEQLLGEEVIEASDIYSFGCVFYEMLTGKPPFYDENPVKVVLKHVSEEPDLNLIPERLRFTLECTLRKSKGTRFSAKFHGDYLKRPEIISVISRVSDAARKDWSYWQVFSLILLFQTSFSCLPPRIGLPMHTFLPMILLIALMSNITTRPNILKVSTGKDAGCWLIITTFALTIPIFLGGPFWPPFTSIGYALCWMTIMYWKSLREKLFAFLRSLTPSAFSLRDPVLNHKQSDILMTVMMGITWVLMAQLAVAFAMPLINLANFGIRYGVLPFSFDHAFQDEFKYHLLLVIAVFVLFFPLHGIFSHRKLFLGIGAVAFSIFSFQQLSMDSLFGYSNAKLASYFPNTQARVLADVAKEPADKKHMEDLEAALQLFNQSPSTANSRLVIANKLLTYQKNFFDGNLYANIVKMELDPTLQNNWPEASKIWDKTFKGVKANCENSFYEREPSYRKKMRALEANLFKIAITNGDAERAQLIIDRWKVIFGEDSIEVKDAQNKLISLE